ncbi:MAG: cation:proton antiporter [Candidatus Zixiibacteriota bacterium]
MRELISQWITPDVGYIALVFVIFVIPRYLQRFRLPSAVSSFALGVVSAALGWFEHDQTIHLLSTLGIVSLFLFAGLEINIADLQANARILTQHLVILSVTLALGAAALAIWLGVPRREALLVALALATPSTGFILDSLDSFGLSAEERQWVKTKAIASELLALCAMFVVLQTLTLSLFLASVGIMLVLVFIVPVVFRIFARLIIPYAPKSEFAFLIMFATVCAFITRKLGVYYLVGAFLVGLAARQFREQLPAVASRKVLDSLEVFASFFVPFYFFYAGSKVAVQGFTLDTVLMAVLFLAVAIPFRLGSVLLHRRLALREGFKDSIRIGVPMLPTLVFTLVIAEILQERFAVNHAIVAALSIYAVGSALVVSFAFKKSEPEYAEDPLRVLERPASE